MRMSRQLKVDIKPFLAKKEAILINNSIIYEKNYPVRICTVKKN